MYTHTPVYSKIVHEGEGEAGKYYGCTYPILSIEPCACFHFLSHEHSMSQGATLMPYIQLVYIPVVSLRREYVHNVYTPNEP